MSNIRELSAAISKSLLNAVRKIPSIDSDPMYITQVHAVAEMLKPVEKAFAGIDGTIKVKSTYVKGKKSFTIDVSYLTALEARELEAQVPDVKNLAGVCMKYLKNGVKQSPSDFKTVNTRLHDIKNEYSMGLTDLGGFSWFVRVSPETGINGWLSISQYWREPAPKDKAQISIRIEVDAV